MYADPDNFLQKPQLPPRKYKGGEEVKTQLSKEEAINTREVRVCVCVSVVCCLLRPLHIVREGRYSGWAHNRLQTLVVRLWESGVRTIHAFHATFP